MSGDTRPDFEFFDAITDYVARALEPWVVRVDALEKQLAAQQPANPHSAQTADEQASVKRQLARHADHLGALETRLKKLEHKGGDE